MSRRRAANLTPFARRLTPAEVAQHWFRRGAEYARDMRDDHPTFPRPAPDGLYLLADVEAWFDRLHGHSKPNRSTREERDEAMRAANGER